jgi:hypothetical protein
MVYVIQVCRQLSSGIRVNCSFENIFEKLVHLFGFIIRKFVTIHGHMNAKYENQCFKMLRANSRDYY